MLRQKIMFKKYTLPAHWASYLINGDATSFQLYDDGDAELARIDAFCEKVHGYAVSCEGEPFFQVYNDAHEPPGTMLEYTFHILEEDDTTNRRPI